MSESGVTQLGPRIALFAAFLLATTLVACRMTPSAPSSPASDDIGTLAGELAAYAAWLREQPDGALQDEIARHEAAGNSPDQMLHLALLLNQPERTTYDAERAKGLLRQLLDAGPAVTAHARLAQVLLAYLSPAGATCGPATCAESFALTRQEEERRQRELRLKLQSTEQQLTSERAQRVRLEKQLEALKSLEEKIGSRETTPPP